MTELSQFKANALAHGEVIHLFHSEVLFIKGMPVTSIYIISKGSIIIFSGDGGRVVRWAGPHQILGMTEVLGGGKWKGIGVRIEDDIVITDFGFEVLTPDVPRTIEEVEHTVQG